MSQDLIGTILKIVPPEDAEAIREALNPRPGPTTPHVGRPANTNDRFRMQGTCRKYSITLADYDAMVLAQEGRCGVCSAAHEVLTIHVHPVSGEVLGLLCPWCHGQVNILADGTDRVAPAVAFLLGEALPQ